MKKFILFACSLSYAQRKMKKEFVNYYEILEASPKASSETIERIFRHLAKTMHPDHSDACDMQQFTLLVEAYETLKDPKLREAYDQEFALHVEQNEELISEAQCADEDSADRHKLLSLFYAKRRRDMRNPGIGTASLSDLMSHISDEVLDFHIWYFRQKEWIAREENGLLAITADGVDKIEATIQRQAQTIDKRITVAEDKVEHKRNTARSAAAAASRN